MSSPIPLPDVSAPAKPHLKVVAGVLLRPNGDFFLASRPEGKAYAGYWEFPGGKIEPNETPDAALVRELHEELGIAVTAAQPWLVQHFDYPHATVDLLFFRVTAWTGQPHPHEGQQFAWQSPDHITVSPVLPANTPIFRALSLPPVLALTCAHVLGEAAHWAALPCQLAAGLSMVIVREPPLNPAALRQFVQKILTHTQGTACRVLVNADPDDPTLWAGLPVAGVHLTEARLLAATVRPDFAWVGASVHSRAALAQAEKLGLDYVLFGSVLPTATHPEATPLGWAGLAAALGDTPRVPVYALGGLCAEDVPTAQQCGAQGVALMRQAWLPSASSSPP